MNKIIEKNELMKLQNKEQVILQIIDQLTTANKFNPPPPQKLKLDMHLKPDIS